MQEKDRNMIHSVYIHIPFCYDICSYCDFCKMYYNEEIVNEYLSALEREIKERYNNEIINTIYIGGGTPSSLNTDQLIRLFDILKILNTKNLEYTIECNIENITEEKVRLFKEYGINRVSVGIQTLNDKYIKFLNRHHTKDEVNDKIKILKEYIDNINIDLIYAIPGETLDELNDDLDYVLSLNVNHISTYSLIIEEHTKLYIDKVSNIDDEIDFEMYKLICKKLKEYGYIHYEISNFSKKGYESKHNLVYWDNHEYYGFGLGASGYINNTRYENTKSINNYLTGKYIYDIHTLDIQEIIQNEFILGFRKLSGINKKEFNTKYNINVNDIETINKLILNNKIIDDLEYIRIGEDQLYTSNDILIEFI